MHKCKFKELAWEKLIQHYWKGLLKSDFKRAHSSPQQTFGYIISKTPLLEKSINHNGNKSLKSSSCALDLTPITVYTLNQFSKDLLG